MCGDHSISSSLVELAQDGLCDGSSGRRLRARTELVYQHEGLVVRIGQHLLHVAQERAVCTEVIVDRLVVSDIDHYPVEHQHLGSL